MAIPSLDGSSSKIINQNMSLLKEFRDFAMKGSVIDLAIGVIIGAAFGKIVSALVNNVIMPPIGLLLGRVDFSNLFFNLSNQTAGFLEGRGGKDVPDPRL